MLRPPFLHTAVPVLALILAACAQGQTAATSTGASASTAASSSAGSGGAGGTMTTSTGGAMTTGTGGNPCGASDPPDGTIMTCYSGPPGTLNLGACVPGITTAACGVWGPCMGEVLPTAEVCDGVDNDCNGIIDEGCASPWAHAFGAAGDDGVRDLVVDAAGNLYATGNPGVWCGGWGRKNVGPGTLYYDRLGGDDSELLGSIDDRVVMGMSQEQMFGDISEEFEVSEESTDYLDGPLSGWARSKRSGEWFAFDCQPIIGELLWHWTLVPGTGTSDPRSALEAAAKARTGYWLSIVEDRRFAKQGTCRLARIECSVAAPVVFAARSRP